MKSPTLEPFADRELHAFEDAAAHIILGSTSPERLQKIGTCVLKNPAYLRLLREQFDTCRLLDELYDRKRSHSALSWKTWPRIAAAGLGALLVSWGLAATLAKPSTATKSPAATMASNVSPVIMTVQTSAPALTQAPPATISAAPSLSVTNTRTDVPAIPVTIVKIQQKETPVPMKTITQTLAATITAAAATAAPIATIAARYPGFTTTEAAIDTRLGDTVYTSEQTLDTAAPLGTIYRFF